MAENKKITTIQEFLTQLSLGHKEIIEKLQKLISATVPDSQERILWSTPWYYLNKKPICYLSNHTHHVDFGFAFGSHFSSNLLEGTGKNMRHIKIKTVEDISKNQIELIRLLKSAAELQFA
jgi:hypothetical protein